MEVRKIEDLVMLKYFDNFTGNFLVNLSFPQSPEQETLWVVVGFENTELSATLSDTPCQLLKKHPSNYA